MIRWDSEYNLLMADSLEEARTIAHSSGPRQVGVLDPILDAIVVYLVLPKGSAVVTHSPDHWGVPSWYSETL
jgi:hypothetical protein